MTKTKKAWLIHTNGFLIQRLPTLEGRELSLKDLYPLIGEDCRIVERVQLKKGVDMWIDEEGLLKAEPALNFEATKLYRAAYPHVDPRELGIVGNAIVIDNTKAGNFI